MTNLVKMEDFKYERPLGVRISNIAAMFVAGFLMAVSLPEDTGFVVTLICTVAACYLADRVHFTFMEKPVIRDLLRAHFEAINKPTRRKGGKK